MSPQRGLIILMTSFFPKYLLDNIFVSNDEQNDTNDTPLTLPIMRLRSFKHNEAKIFENQLNPVMSWYSLDSLH